ncbi:MAG: superoxide dismutase [Ferruginibacter sp.]
MENNSGNSRRKFLTGTAKAAAIVTLSSSAAASLLESCAAPQAMAYPKAFSTGYEQTPLPYAYDALENIIDARTMEIHYTKHAAAYSKALKEAVQAEAVPFDTAVETILGNISKYSVKMRNNAGGHYNHEMFWRSMRPKTTDNKPSGTLMTAIENTFGSFAAFKTSFSDAGKNRFGSGWAWLYRDNKGTLKIGSTPNQDNPLMSVSEIKGLPLLGLDVWEHAYYLKYQNKRADYIENWWSLVNWNYVAQRFG